MKMTACVIRCVTFLTVKLQNFLNALRNIHLILPSHFLCSCNLLSNSATPNNVLKLNDIRNMFCGKWYLPHNQVHNDRSVPIIVMVG